MDCAERRYVHVGERHADTDVYTNDSPAADSAAADAGGPPGLSADGSTLATYSAAAGMLVLFASHLRQPKQVLPRRRLFLPSIAIKHAMDNHP